MKTKLFYLTLFILLALVSFKTSRDTSIKLATKEYDSCLYSDGSLFPTEQTNACITKDGKILPAPSIDPSKNNTYINTKYGYSFEYPSTIIVSENAGKIGYIRAAENAEWILLHNRFPNMRSQDISIVPKSSAFPTNQTLDEYVKNTTRYKDGILLELDEPYNQQPAQKVISYQEYKVDGKPAIKLISQILPGQGSTEDIFFRAWIEYQPGKVLTFSDSMGQYHDLSLDEQIFKSFKFTN